MLRSYYFDIVSSLQVAGITSMRRAGVNCVERFQLDIITTSNSKCIRECTLQEVEVGAQPFLQARSAYSFADVDLGTGSWITPLINITAMIGPQVIIHPLDVDTHKTKPPYLY